MIYHYEYAYMHKETAELISGDIWAYPFLGGYKAKMEGSEGRLMVSFSTSLNAIKKTMQDVATSHKLELLSEAKLGYMGEEVDE